MSDKDMSRCWYVKITAEDLQKANSFFLKSLAVDIYEQHPDSFAVTFQELLTKYALDVMRFDCRWIGAMMGVNEDDSCETTLYLYLFFAEGGTSINALQYFTNFASEVKPIRNISAGACWSDLDKQSNLTYPSLYRERFRGMNKELVPLMTDFDCYYTTVPELPPCVRAELGDGYGVTRFIKPNSDIIVDKITKTDGSIFQFEEIVSLVKKIPRYNWKGFKYDEEADEQKELIFEWSNTNIGNVVSLSDILPLSGRLADLTLNTQNEERQQEQEAPNNNNTLSEIRQKIFELFQDNGTLMHRYDYAKHGKPFAYYKGYDTAIVGALKIIDEYLQDKTE